MARRTVQIADRYQGFPGLAMGGISGGLVARAIGTEAEVTFHRPIPTGEALELVEADEDVELRLADDIGAQGTPTSVDLEIPTGVTYEDAVVATESYTGHHQHPYPSCFTCGPDRSQGDGLRVFPGLVENGPGIIDNGPLVAAAWTPDPALAEADGELPLEYIWAAVDCPSIWPLIEAAAPHSPDHVVTGRLAVRLDEPVRAGEPHIVAGWPIPGEGRQRRAGAMILDGSGTVKAVAQHTLIVTDWGVPLGTDNWGSREK